MYFQNHEAAASHPKADQRLDITIPCLSEFRVRDLPVGILSNVDSPFALLHGMGKRLPYAAAVVVNTMQGLDPAIDTELASTFKNYLPVGPFNLLSPPRADINNDDDDECIAWLDRRDPSSVAYVNFSTIDSLPPSELAELAHGLEASGALFLWSLKNRESLPFGFLDRTKKRGLVMGWVPQTRVLAHKAVGVFVSHCGWSSVMEAVGCGLPMICWPTFADQFLAGRAICSVWKIGFGFEGGTVKGEELVTTLGKVLNGEDEEGREIRKRSHELKTRAWQEVAPGGAAANNLDRLLEIVKD